MIRSIIVFALCVLILWAPWMDRNDGKDTVNLILAEYGPLPSTCYDGAGNLLQDGVTLRWYPLGRLVHTCADDYVAWIWGDVRRLGGFEKAPEEIRDIQSRALSCQELLPRIENRMSTSSVAVATFEGAATTSVLLAPHEELLPRRSEIERAVAEGPNFAGAFRVVEWSCGPECTELTVVDVRSGEVVSEPLQSSYGFSYAEDKRVLVTNPRQNLPELPETDYEAESIGLSLARVPREYYILTRDELSGEEYLIRECVESAATGYIAVSGDLLE